MVCNMHKEDANEFRSICFDLVDIFAWESLENFC